MLETIVIILIIKIEISELFLGKFLFDYIVQYFQNIQYLQHKLIYKIKRILTA